MTREQYMEQYSSMRLSDLEYLQFRIGLALGPPYNRGDLIAETIKDLPVSELKQLMILDDAPLKLQFIILRLR